MSDLLLSLLHASRTRKLFWLFALWGAAIFWFAGHLPMLDLPEHAGQVTLLRSLLFGHSPWGDAFRINWFTPYLLGYCLTLLFSSFLPIASALKLVLSLTYLAFVASCVQLRKQFGGDERLDWLFLPSFFGFDFWWGFFSFQVAAPITICFFLVADRFANEQTRRRGLPLVLLGLILLFSHGLAFALGWGIGVAFLVARLPKPKQLAIALVPYAILASVSLACFFTLREVDASIDPTPWVLGYGVPFLWRMRVAPLYSLASAEGLHAYTVDVYWCAAIFIAICLAPFLLKLKVNWQQRSSWIAFLCILAVYLGMPADGANTGYLYERYAVFLLPAYAWMFHATQARGSAPPRTIGLSRVAVPIMVCGCLAVLGVTSLKVYRFGVETSGIDAAFRALDPGKRALALTYDLRSPAADNGLEYIHYSLWYQAEEAGLVDVNFAWYVPQIVRYQPGHQPPAPLKMDKRPWLFHWKAGRAEDYDYFIVHGLPGASDALFAEADCPPVLKIATGEWRIFERCHSH